MKLNLNGIWQAERTDKQKEALSMPGSVPGCVINDLIKADKLPRELFWRDNARAVRAFEEDSWHYSRTFRLETLPSPDTVLVFERLDTYCDVYVNGVHAGSAADGHIPHRFPVGTCLRTGDNRVDVYFRSPITEVRGKKSLPAAFTNERLHTRRMQCTYGWDWTERFVTVGIGADVYLDMPEDTPLTVEHVYVYTLCVEDTSAAIGMDISLKDPGAGALMTFTVYDRDGAPVWQYEKWCAEPLVRVTADIPGAALWYPVGYGDQPLYRLVLSVGGEELSETVFGIRTVRVEQLPDLPGTENYEKCVELKKSDFSREYDENTAFSGFILKVNGKKILCRGANWVPCEPFITEGINAKVTRHLELARAGGVNMLRIWGGGTFETDHFYSECSRLGIMVTQDFLMACGQYPEDEAWFIQALRKETEYAAYHMRNQACLMWWSGDNENAIRGCDTDKNYQGRASAYRGIAPVLYALDPYRPFFPSSPFGGAKYASNTVGTTHNTQYLGNFFDWLVAGDYDDYKEYLATYNARFIAEEPTMGAVSTPSLRRMMTEADILGGDITMWLYHTQSNPGLPRELFEYTELFARGLFGDYTDGEDALFKRKYIQYEWLRVSLERVRREMWFCSGVIYWMMEDCWPAASGWALTDYYGIPKDSFYSFRRLAAHKVLSVHGEGDTLSVYISNDTEDAVPGTLTLTRIRDGVRLGVSEYPVTAPLNGAAVVHTLPKDTLAPGDLLVADVLFCDGSHDRTFWRPGRLPIHPTTVTIERETGAITLSSDTYVHTVELEGEMLFEDNCFSLLPGERRRITYTTLPGKGPADEIRVTAYTVT